MVKRIVDVHSLEGIIEVAGMSGLYMTLDKIHMASLRDYVYTHLTYEPGQKPRSKKEMIRAVVEIVQQVKEDQNKHRCEQSHKHIDETTRRYAADALDECGKMKKVLKSTCSGFRRYTKKCREAKSRLKGSDWVKMEENIRRIRSCDENCADSVVDAAGDIGNYIASCPGVTCYETLRITGNMPGGPCKRFRK